MISAGRCNRHERHALANSSPILTMTLIVSMSEVKDPTRELFEASPAALIASATAVSLDPNKSSKLPGIFSIALARALVEALWMRTMSSPVC